MAIDGDTGTDDGLEATTPPAPVDHAPPPLPPPTLLSVPTRSLGGLAQPYREPERLTTFARVSLVGVVVVTMATAAACLAERQLIGTSAGIDLDRLQAADDRRRVLWSAMLVTLATSSLAFILLTRRLYRNLRPLGVGDLRFSEGWAVGAWFVPFLNLVRPKQIVDDIWRASGSTTGQARSWHLDPVSPLLHAWWCLWIVAMFMVVGADNDLADQDGVRSALLWRVEWLVVLGACALVTLQVVVRLADRQRRCAAARGLLPPDAGSGRRSNLVDGLVPLALGVATFTAAYVLPLDGARADDGHTITELQVGACFQLPMTDADGPSDVDLVDVVPCTSPHDLEVFAIVTHPAGTDIAFPGDDVLEAFAMERCADAFEPAIGVAPEDSSLGIAASWPSGDWTFGARQLGCLTGLPGQRLDRSVLGSGM